MCGATCVKDDRHEAGVKMLEFIIKYNITDWDNWIWIEASGKIEEMCKKAGAFNVPTRFAEVYLNPIPFTPVDEYHYERKVRGANEIKTLFGLKDKESFELIRNELNNKVLDFLERFNLNENQSMYAKYMAKKHPVYKYKSIIDYFVYLKDDEQYNEFTEQAMDILKNSILSIVEFLEDETLTKEEKYYLKMAVDEGNRVIRTSSIIKPIELSSFSAR